MALNNRSAFAAALRRVGDLLARSGTGDEEALATELDTLTAALGTIRPGAAPAPFPSAPRPAPTPTPAPPRAAAPVVPVVKALPPPPPPRPPPAKPETPPP